MGSSSSDQSLWIMMRSVVAFQVLAKLRGKQQNIKTSCPGNNPSEQMTWKRVLDTAHLQCICELVFCFEYNVNVLRTVSVTHLAPMSRLFDDGWCSNKTDIPSDPTTPVDHESWLLLSLCCDRVKKPDDRLGLVDQKSRLNPKWTSQAEWRTLQVPSPVESIQTFLTWPIEPSTLLLFAAKSESPWPL